jgi:hypothetical protein
MKLDFEALWLHAPRLQTWFKKVESDMNSCPFGITIGRSKLTGLPSGYDRQRRGAVHHVTQTLQQLHASPAACLLTAQGIQSGHGPDPGGCGLIQETRKWHHQ